MTALKNFTHSSLVIVEELNNIPQTIIEFTHNNWNSYSQENINYNIAIVLSLLFPFKYFGDNPKLKVFGGYVIYHALALYFPP